MDSKNNESHIGSDDLFGDTELTAEEKIAAAEADLAKARARAAEGGKIAGEARTAGDERRRIKGVLRGDPEPKLTAYEEQGTQVSDLATNVTIEQIHQSQADAAEAARGELERLARDERIRAQEAINEGVSGPIKEALRKKHPKRGERNIADSTAHTEREEEWKKTIARGRDGEPVEPPMKTADTVPEARERLKEIIAERDEPTT